VFEFGVFLVPLALTIFVIAGAVVAFIALQKVKDQGAEIRALELRLKLLAEAVAGVERAETTEAAPEPIAPHEPEPIPEPEPTPEPEPARASPAEAPPTAPPAPTAASGRRAWEEAFTSRWLVWLGAVTLALGGFFLVKYSIDQGWLGPTVRVLAGALMGLALTAGGEWLRRRPLERALAQISPSYVPPALTSAGVATLFATVYAAYALYDMLPQAIAFGLLAAVAAAAVAMSLLQGPFVALLGIVGAFVTPAIVSTGTHRPEVLFPYLVILIAGALASLRYMGWWWLGWCTLVGAVVWPLIWFAVTWRPDDVYYLGIYLLVLGGQFTYIRFPTGTPPATLPGLFRLDALPHPERTAWAALAAVAVLMVILVRMDRYGLAALACTGIAAAAMLAIARREAVFDAIPIVAGLMVAAIVALWHLPAIVTVRAPMWILDGQAFGLVDGPVVPPELATFLAVATIYSGIFAFGGFAALWGAYRPALWAALSAAVPLVLFALAFWRIKDFEVDLAWTLAALALAALLVVAAERVARYRDTGGMTGALGAYAIGVVAALALAATTALEDAWLTAALALELPAMAWIEGQLKLPALRRAAIVLASVILIRLVLNPLVLDYPIGGIPVLNWLLYGYGLPALAFFLAARWFRDRADDVTVTVLEAGTLVFSVLLISLEIRHLITGGPLAVPGYPLEEQALNSIAWLTIAYALYRRHDITGRAVPVWGWRILAGMATAQIVLLQLLVENPLFTDDPVGTWPILDIMALAYGVPAVFAVLFLRHARRLEHVWLARIAGGLALALPFVWLTLEVRHAFQGSRLGYGWSSDAEWYAYSVAWLTFAAVLLALAIWRGYVALRYASLGIVMVTVAKVFLSDMAALTGIYRALSFIGLGLVLVAVGYFYRRFVFPPSPPSNPPPTGEEAATRQPE
jgi:uncharacterized membrane protein